MAKSSKSEVAVDDVVIFHPETPSTVNGLKNPFNDSSIYTVGIVTAVLTPEVATYKNKVVPVCFRFNELGGRRPHRGEFYVGWTRQVRHNFGPLAEGAELVQALVEYYKAQK
tara:strand:+ start:1111 stop:1446 length:336 start_codon:yes stop_codon:yes gene_type:complete